MIQFFRSFLGSKVGLAIAMLFLGVIFFAFAAGDISGSTTFGGVSGGDRVAVVGKSKISASDLDASVRSEFSQLRQQNPTATMEAFIADGGMESVLQGVLDRTAIAEFARKYGLRAGHRLVDSEFVKNPNLRGPDGKFSQEAFRAALAQQGLTEALVRDDVTKGLLIRQALAPISAPGAVPEPLAKRYAALLRERRTGSVGLLLSDAYAPTGNPTDAQLKTFYDANRASYMRPERRIIRFATFGDEALKDIAAPTDAEIQARYQTDIAQYTATDRRSFSQLVVPTQAAANVIRDEVAKGKTLDQAAREKGLAVAQIGPVTKQQLAEQASAQVAEAAFAAPQGQIAAAARGGLGYYVLRVDGSERTAGRSLAQVRGEISAALSVQKRTTALADLSAQLEERFDDGANLAEVARDLGIQLQTTQEVLGNGAVYNKPGETAPQILAPALSTAFEMEEGEPQLAEIEPGKTFMIFDVSRVTPAAAAPIADVREAVVSAWRRSEGDKKAKLAADRVLKRVAAGETVAAAMAKEGVKLPAPDQINMNREQLSQFGGRVPPVMALMFSMAEGTAKRLEAPNDNGWFVVKLDDIEPGKLAEKDPAVAQVMQQLGQVTAREYESQFVRAVSDEMRVERNQAAIKAVEDQLAGRNRQQ